MLLGAGADRGASEFCDKEPGSIGTSSRRLLPKFCSGVEDDTCAVMGSASADAGAESPVAMESDGSNETMGCRPLPKICGGFEDDTGAAMLLGASADICGASKSPAETAPASDGANGTMVILLLKVSSGVEDDTGASETPEETAPACSKGTNGLIFNFCAGADDTS